MMHRRGYIIGCMVLLIGLGAATLWPHRLAVSRVQSTPEPKPVTHSLDKPNESPPPKTYAWKGTAADPKYINLPTIAAAGFVQFMGVDQNRQVAAPESIYLAGWYVNSVRPGEVGLSIIDGHVDGYQKPGIFNHLALLKPADQFTVERGDGRKLTFRVRQVATLDVSAATQELFARNPDIASQLNIITCGGTFKQSTGYDQRVVVTAELVS